MTLFQQRVLWNFSRLRSRHKIRFLTMQLSQSLHWPAHTPKEQSGVKHEKCEELKVLIKHLRITSYWPYERTNENSCNFGFHFKSCRDGPKRCASSLSSPPPFFGCANCFVFHLELSEDQSIVSDVFSSFLSSPFSLLDQPAAAATRCSPRDSPGKSVTENHSSVW